MPISFVCASPRRTLRSVRLDVARSSRRSTKSLRHGRRCTLPSVVPVACGVDPRSCGAARASREVAASGHREWSTITTRSRAAARESVRSPAPHSAGPRHPLPNAPRPTHPSSRRAVAARLTHALITPLIHSRNAAVVSEPLPPGTVPRVPVPAACRARCEPRPNSVAADQHTRVATTPGRLPSISAKQLELNHAARAAFE